MGTKTMRLICPNCDAQYEIADNVIPQDGRDVQCSNCGNTWFQEASDASGDSDAASGNDFDETAGPETEPMDDGDGGDDGGAWVADPEPAARTANAQDDETDDEDPFFDDADAPGEGGPPDSPLAQSTVSEESAAILREEALRELKARLADKEGIEEQSDLGLSAATRRRGAESSNLSLYRFPVPGDGLGVSRDKLTSDAVAETVAPGRARLPDIEEINPRLVPTAAARSAAVAGDVDKAVGNNTRRRAGFRFGFLLVLIAAAAYVGAYAFAPMISEKVPGAAPVLADLVAQTDAVRVSFNAWAVSTIESLRALIDSALNG